ncbi:MAG TPA: polyphosphate kinase 1, partial [Bacteroidia bacterium]
ERVLQEAADKTVPLIERIKFLGIFSNNLDEFFRVRFATLRRMSEFKKKAKAIIGENPVKLLKQIHKTVISQQKKFDEIYKGIIKELETQNIFIIDEKQLNEEQQIFVKKYFEESVLPTLAPIMIDSIPKFPYLRDKSIYFAVKLSKKDDGNKFIKYALIQIPTDVLPRFTVLPKKDDRKNVILLDDIIRLCLPDVFSIFEFDKAEAYTIKLTRDAELDIDHDLSKSISEKIEKSLKQRKKGKPVRLVYDSAIPSDLLDFITDRIKMKKSINLIPGGRYHNFKDFIRFPNLGGGGMTYNLPKPLQHPDLKNIKSMFSVIKRKDILLCYPYQSFNHIIDLLREASIDPKVISIKISLYRVAKNSNVVYALTNAIKNGKQVTVVVELQARFDEEANIFWANQLKEEGVNVIYGVPGLKVHSKIFLITRREGNGIVEYAHIGTGNFNEDTATLYCDHSLLTADQRITNEVSKVFNFYGNNFKTGNYKHLVIAPFFMRKKIMKYINREISNAKLGREAYMIIKLNSLVDKETIKKLYEASQAGVKIKLIVRSNCSIVPGRTGLSENIEVISIVDKLLEHARIFLFCNGGDERFFISSADWMLRNFDQRNEVAVPIYDKKIQQDLKMLLNLQLSDNTKARILDVTQSNVYKTQKPGDKKVRAQDEIYSYFKNQQSNK